MKTSLKLSSRHRRLLRSGFTLMEMILVLAIIGILVGLGIFAMKGVVGDAEIGKAMADIRTLQTNIVRYRTMAGFVPSQSQGLEALSKKPSGNPAPRSWRQLMDASALTDPWGHPYQYRNPGKKETGGYDVYSTGPDGQDGTQDDVYPN
ncbi:MAG: ral secretion pathway protein [Verrucomicrobiaceae bacterium]|nr:ral secretion pathway protein [Verrucomicrobiaceae bacterium]